MNPDYPANSARETSPRRVRGLATALLCIEMRKTGASFAKIAETMRKETGRETFSRQRAHKLTKLGLQWMNDRLKEEVEEVRRLEVERLDELWAQLYDDRAIPRTADTMLRIMERRSRLLGLDAPTRFSGPNGEPLIPDTLDPKAALEAAMNRVAEAMKVPAPAVVAPGAHPVAATTGLGAEEMSSGAPPIPEG